ncbi:hypothetical protein H6G00_01020 [Leptolyngbya sp. FACHB-541]|uniref:hypothetical protein n=1 Tax=Leptolyngbya sp. FACHB-541 TaxID=2692810 RepID=UPI0016873F60|nr:hypothetical protein [Leptolyngbya sp. FACHB-541]MBD1995210.1 hypothetical protein [Leptolyngbya sp. FACHB-541]
MTEIIVGRAKKPAKRQNYKISYELLAGLKGVAILEDRSDTAQLERWIREGVDRWRLENPSKTEKLDELISSFLANEGAEEG